MDKKRREEISLILLKYKAREEGMPYSPKKLRELRNIATSTNIPFDELKEFMRIIAQELLDETFSQKKVA